MAYALLAASLVSGGVSAYQSYRAGREEKKAQERNARLLERDAGEAIDASALDATLVRRTGRLTGSAQQAGFSAGGVTLEGSPLLMLQETKSLSELDAMRVEYGGELEARRLRDQAQNARYAGNQAGKAGTMNAIGTLLSTGMSAAGTYYTGQQQRGLAEMQRNFYSSRGY